MPGELTFEQWYEKKYGSAFATQSRVAEEWLMYRFEEAVSSLVEEYPESAEMVDNLRGVLHAYTPQP